MNHLVDLFRMRQRLEFSAEKYNLAYICETKIIGYSEAETVVEDNGVSYDYPEYFDVTIESWSTFKVSFRPSDGRWIREGQDLSGPGLSTPQMYRRVRANLRAHAKKIAIK